jgi:hypothetical protein
MKTPLTLKEKRTLGPFTEGEPPFEVYVRRALIN